MAGRFMRSLPGYQYLGWPGTVSRPASSACRSTIHPTSDPPATVCRVYRSFITVGELAYGAKLGGWGPERLKRLGFEINRAQTVWPGPVLVDTYVAMRTWCTKAGHGLAGKEHEADRWIAATAPWLGVPLVAHDAIFANVDGLQLLTKLDR